MTKFKIILFSFFLNIAFCQTFDYSVNLRSMLINYSQNNNTVLDPENKFDIIQKKEFVNLSLLKIDAEYFNEENLLIKTKYQLDYTNQYSDDFEHRFIEFYLSYSLAENVEVVLGRKLSDWGVSYYKRPSAIFDPELDFTDLNNSKSYFTGLDLFQIDYYADSFSLSYVYSNDIENFNSFNSINALKSMFMYKGWSVSLIYAFDNLKKNRIGAGFTNVFGETLEIHGEFLFTQKGKRKVFNNSGMGYESVSPFVKFSLGFLYSINWNGRDVRWITEFYYNGSAYNKDTWTNYKDFIKSNYYGYLSNPAGGSASGYLTKYIQASSSFNIELMSDATIFTILDNLPPLFGKIAYRPVFLINPRDGSTILNFYSSCFIIDNLNAFFSGNIFFGGKETVFGAIPYNYEIFFGLNYKLEF